MPGILKFTPKIEHSNGGLKLPFAPGTIDLGQTTIGGRLNVQIIGTSAEAIDFGDVGTLGLVCLQNLDATNYVDFGPDSGGTLIPFVRLKPNEVAVFRAKPGITIKAQANVTACRVLVGVYED